MNSNSGMQVKEEDPTDKQCLKIEQKRLLPFCGSWTEGTYACYGPNIVKLKSLEARFHDDDSDEEDFYVEQVLDMSLCKFHGIQIL